MHSTLRIYRIRIAIKTRNFAFVDGMIIKLFQSLDNLRAT